MVSSDLRPETGFDAWFVKILTFQAQFLLLNPQFFPSPPFVLFLLPQIFLHFPADCGSCNVGNKDEQCGEIGVARSRGCIATLSQRMMLISFHFISYPRRGKLEPPCQKGLGWQTSQWDVLRSPGMHCPCLENSWLSFNDLSSHEGSYEKVNGKLLKNLHVTQEPQILADAK